MRNVQVRLSEFKFRAVVLVGFQVKSGAESEPFEPVRVMPQREATGVFTALFPNWKDMSDEKKDGVWTIFPAFTQSLH